MNSHPLTSEGSASVIELLKLAAKAAGFEKTTTDENGWFRVSLTANLNPSFDEWELWNPRTDDGDALRLAVKLNIVPRSVNGVAFAWCDGVAELFEPHNGDPYAATRLAILRVAAQIGGAA